MIVPLSDEEGMFENSFPSALSEYLDSLPQFLDFNIGQCGGIGFRNGSGEGKIAVLILVL